jgi:hypothetical protein
MPTTMHRRHDEELSDEELPDPPELSDEELPDPPDGELSVVPDPPSCVASWLVLSEARVSESDDWWGAPQI